MLRGMGVFGSQAAWAVLLFSGAGLPPPLQAASIPAPRPLVPAPRPARFSTVILLSPFPVCFSAFAGSLLPFNDAESYRVLSAQHRKVSTRSCRIPAESLPNPRGVLVCVSSRDHRGSAIRPRPLLLSVELGFEPVSVSFHSCFLRCRWCLL